LRVVKDVNVIKTSKGVQASSNLKEVSKKTPIVKFSRGSQ